MPKPRTKSYLDVLPISSAPRVLSTAAMPRRPLSAAGWARVLRMLADLRSGGGS